MSRCNPEVMQMTIRGTNFSVVSQRQVPGVSHSGPLCYRTLIVSNLTLREGIDWHSYTPCIIEKGSLVILDERPISQLFGFAHTERKAY